MEFYKIPDFIIIDDDEVNNVLCKKVIHVAYPNTYVTTFSDTKEALEYLTSGNAVEFSKVIVFLDINMPLVSGWDFVKSFESLDNEIKDQLKIYILSSSVDPFDKVRSTANKNIWNYISKPLTRHAVENTVNELHKEERAAFAREIHDQLGQQLARIKMDTSWLSSKIENRNDLIDQKIKDALTLIDDTIETVRGINKGLRPRIIDDLGLFAAIEWLAIDFTSYSGLSCMLNIDMAEPEFSKLLSDNIYRIFQEALTNIVRYAEATEVKASITYMDTNMLITIQDNGKGFNKKIKKRGSFGLIGLKERASVINGSLEIISEINKGTTIKLLVPVII